MLMENSCMDVADIPGVKVQVVWYMYNALLVQVIFYLN